MRGGEEARQTKWRGNEVTDGTDEEARIQSRGCEKGGLCELKTLIKKACDSEIRD